MAERRMFAKAIIDSDAFLDMPLSTQALYFHLSMRADDEGFVGNPKKIQRMIGASDDDSKLLVMKRFILTFDSGIIVIKHWKIHNYIQADRFKETTYLEEKSMLALNENNAYTERIHNGYNVDTECIHNGYNVDTQVRLGKDRDSLELGEDSLGNSAEGGATPTAPKRFKKPTLEEIIAYCKERNNNVDAERFVDFYEAKGWMIGKNAMKDWKAAVRTWERKDKEAHRGEENGEAEDDIDYSVYNVKR